jgi:hypothetical protein
MKHLINAKSLEMIEALKPRRVLATFNATGDLRLAGHKIRRRRVCPT